MLVNFIKCFRIEFFRIINLQDQWSKGEIFHAFLLALDFALAQLNHKHKEKR